MRAIVISEFSVPPQVRDVPIPVPHDDAVVVEVEATGLCRSDWHAWAGHDDGITLPHIPGHELLGRVVSAGADVRRITIGERMITPFVCGCGSCPECLAGHSQVCRRQTQPGFTHDGSFAEFVEVRHADHNAIVVDPAIPAADLVTLGCRFATAFRGLHDRARITAEDHVVVVGCGGVGLSAVMIAAALGARVTGVDVSAGALTQAERAGASRTVDATGLDPEELAAAIIAEGRPTVSVDALGAEATASAGLIALAPGGRHVQLGLFASPPRLPITRELLADHPRLPIPRVIGEELTILGSHGMAAGDYSAMLELIASGRLRPGDLVTREIGLGEAAEALAAWDAHPSVGVTLIRPDRA